MYIYIIKYGSTYLIVGIGQKSYGFMNFHTLKNNLAIDFTRKSIWHCCNDAVPWLNETKSRMYRCTVGFKIHLHFVCLPPAVRPSCARCRAPEFHTIKVMVADLRKCCSEDDLPTALWQFLLSFIPFLVLL